MVTKMKHAFTDVPFRPNSACYSKAVKTEKGLTVRLAYLINIS